MSTKPRVISRQPAEADRVGTGFERDAKTLVWLTQLDVLTPYELRMNLHRIGVWLDEREIELPHPPPMPPVDWEAFEEASPEDDNDEEAPA